jgi:hypothetical protein
MPPIVTSAEIERPAALARAFPWLPLFAEAGTQLPALAEMAADDVAARRHAPGDLAAALVILAHAGTQSAALTAGGPAAIIRIQRLLAPPSRPGLPVRAARLATGAAALTFPIAIACIPLLIAACSVTCLHQEQLTGQKLEGTSVFVEPPRIGWTTSGWP